MVKLRQINNLSFVISILSHLLLITALSVPISGNKQVIQQNNKEMVVIDTHSFIAEMPSNKIIADKTTVLDNEEREDRYNPDSFGKKSSSSDFKKDETELIRFKDLIRKEIEKRKKYPLIAKKRDIDGIVEVSFLLNSDGSLSHLMIERSSNYRILDQAALELIHTTVPFPAFPDTLKDDSIQINVSIVYSK